MFLGTYSLLRSCSTMYMNIEVWGRAMCGSTHIVRLASSSSMSTSTVLSSYAGTKHKAEPVTVNG
jgi:short-subunit dehydrogenase